MVFDQMELSVGGRQKNQSFKEKASNTAVLQSSLFLQIEGYGTMKRYTKEEAVAIAVQCAEQYHSELEGKNLLFICCNKHKKIFSIELSFYGNNYMHLTGLKPKKTADGKSEVAQDLFANDFYQKCLDHKLSPADFDFSDDGTTHMKLAVLPGIICKNLHASIIGDYNSSKPRLYTEKIVGGIHACMGFIFDSEISEYVPNTVIKEDIRDLTANEVRVIAVYRKPARAEQYEEITYKAKKVDWASIKYPEEYQYLMAL